MQGSCARLLCVSLAALIWLSTSLSAGVFSATVESVSVNDRTITVKIAKKEKIQKFDVRASAIITIDNQSASLDDLAQGQTVSVTTNGVDEVTKLVVRTERPKAVEPKTPVKKPTEKPMKKPVKKPTDNEPEVAVGEWPQFRGPNRDNVSTEPGLLAKWPEDGPSLAWKQTGLGQGYSSVSVVKGKVFTMGNRGDDEYLIALNAETGDEIWALKTGKAYHDGTGDGPRGTPTVDEERVYALGANGELVCAGIEKGDSIWQVNILKEYGGNNIQWGISESVLVDGDHVLCTPGGKKATLVALNKHTGKPAWRSVVPGLPQAGYASMIPIEVGNVKLYVNFVHTGVVGVKASDGKFLWQDQKSANGTANCSSPVFYDDSIFSASGYGTGGAMVKLAAQGSQVRATLEYETKKMKNHHGGMAAVGEFLYGFDESTLTCLELKSGKVKWEDRSVGKGSLTIADGMLYLRSEQGPVALAEVTQDGYNETGRFDQPDRSDKPSWSHPVVAGGKLYLRDMDTLLAFVVKGEE